MKKEVENKEGIIGSRLRERKRELGRDKESESEKEQNSELSRSTMT